MGTSTRFLARFLTASLWSLACYSLLNAQIEGKGLSKAKGKK